MLKLFGGIFAIHILFQSLLLNRTRFQLHNFAAIILKCHFLLLLLSFVTALIILLMKMIHHLISQTLILFQARHHPMNPDILFGERPVIELILPGSAVLRFE